MGRNTLTTDIIDGILRYLATGGVLNRNLPDPDTYDLIDKRFTQYMNLYAETDQVREYRRLVSNMKKQGLIGYSKELPAIQLTDTGRSRAEKSNLDHLFIPAPEVWDQQWRIVMFRAPDSLRVKRDAFTKRLKELGFQQLQRGVWLHPYPCEPQINQLGIVHGLTPYISFIEASKVTLPKPIKGSFVRTLRN